MELEEERSVNLYYINTSNFTYVRLSEWNLNRYTLIERSNILIKQSVGQFVTCLHMYLYIFSYLNDYLKMKSTKGFG